MNTYVKDGVTWGTVTQQDFAPFLKVAQPHIEALNALIHETMPKEQRGAACFLFSPKDQKFVLFAWNPVLISDLNYFDPHPKMTEVG